MKKSLVIAFICLSAIYWNTPSVSADTLVMFNNTTVSGTIIQTNGDNILVLANYAAFNFSKANIKDIKAGTVEGFSNASRIPNFKNALLFLSKQPWATNLTPIAATVIDKGILRNVPYTSFRCGEDYEVNVYGDLNNPAGIEIGVYRRLLQDASAKRSCIEFISDVLGQAADREIVQSLDLNKDTKTRDGLTFEISPPTEEDSYNGWWISVYSEQKLNLARASDKELSDISLTKSDALKEANQSDSPDSWSTNELKLARPTAWPKISFTNKSGILISDADVVRVNDGVSLVWEKGGGASGGVVRLEDLPEPLQIQFGYDPAKTARADALEQQRKQQWQQDVATSAAQVAAQPAPAQIPDFSYSPADSGSYSGGGRVYVHGYFRSNGTYVNAYTRSYPHHR